MTVHILLNEQRINQKMQLPIKTDGILGTNFLHKHNCLVDYEYKLWKNYFSTSWQWIKQQKYIFISKKWEHSSNKGCNWKRYLCTQQNHGERHFCTNKIISSKGNQHIKILNTLDEGTIINSLSINTKEYSTLPRMKWTLWKSDTIIEIRVSRW